MSIQNISNDNINPSHNVITTKYTCKNIDSNWVHRDIEYNVTGNPILRLYVDDEKQINKDFYINGVKTNAINENEINDIENEYFSFISKTGRIKAKKQTDYPIVITKDLFSPYIFTAPHDIINDTDLIIIIEEKPILKEIKYNCSNPLYITNNIDITFKGLYSDGFEYNLENVFDVNKIKLLSSNKHWFTVTNHLLNVVNINGIAFLDIANRNELIDYILPTEPLKVIITDKNNSHNLNESFTISHKYVDNYNLVAGKENKSYLSFDEVYTNDTISHTVSMLKYVNYEITDLNIISLRNNEIIPKNIGTTNILGSIESIINCKYYDMDSIFNIVIDVKKEIKDINFYIVDQDENIIAKLDDKFTVPVSEKNIYKFKVDAIYSDNSSSDISSSVIYSYPENIITMFDNYSFKCNLKDGEYIISALYETPINSINKNITLKIYYLDSELYIYGYINGNNILENDIINIQVGDKITLDLGVNLNKNVNFSYYLNDIHVNGPRISINDNSVINTELACNSTLTIKALSINPIEENIHLTIYARINNEIHAVRTFEIKTTAIYAKDIIVYLNDDKIENNSEINIGLVSKSKYILTFATNPETISFMNFEYHINDIENAPILCDWNLNESNTELIINPIKVGTCTIKISTSFNLDTYTSFTLNVIENYIDDIVISDGNDLDYAYYDYKARTNEKFIDDFPRYYVPHNNSYEIPYSIVSSTNNGVSPVYDLKFLSSDRNLIRCTNVNDKCIITATATVLELYGDDDINDNSRYPNMCWVTILDTISGKSATCQVRVTRNQIVSINIPYLEEEIHKKDDYEDNESESSTNDNYVWEYDTDYFYSTEEEFDANVEYRLDVHVGDTLEFPITLNVQDKNFGASNQIGYQYSVSPRSQGYDWKDINVLGQLDNSTNFMDCKAKYVNSLNDFHITNYTGEEFLKLSEAEQDFYFNSISSDKEYTFSDIVYKDTILAIDKSTSTCNHSNTHNFDGDSYSISDLIDLKKNLNLTMKCCKPGSITLRAKIDYQYDEPDEKYFYASSVEICNNITNSSGYATLVTNINELMEKHGDDDIDDVTTNNYKYKSDRNGFKVRVRYKTSKSNSSSIPNALVEYDATGKIIVSVPEKKGSSYIYITDEEYNVKNRHIEVTVTDLKDNEPIENMLVVIKSLFRTKPGSSYKYDEYIIASKTNSSGVATNPSENPIDTYNLDTDLNITVNAKPGEGKFYAVPVSRYIKINVTEKIENGEMQLFIANNGRVKNNGINDEFIIWPENEIIEIKHDSSLINQLIKLKVELENDKDLDKKYTTVAWFVSDNDIKIVEIPPNNNSDYFGPSTEMNLQITFDNDELLTDEKFKDIIYTVYVTNIKSGFTISRRFKLIKNIQDDEIELA